MRNPMHKKHKYCFLVLLMFFFFSRQVRLEGIAANRAGQFAVVLEVTPRFGFCIPVSILFFFFSLSLLVAMH